MKTARIIMQMVSICVLFFVVGAFADADETKQKTAEAKGSHFHKATARDLMIDIKDQQVVYAAMGHGGILGVNEELFAIPWDAIEIRSLTAKAEDEAFILNVDKTVFDTNQGFDKDNWPIEGDRKLIHKEVRPEV